MHHDGDHSAFLHQLRALFRGARPRSVTPIPTPVESIASPVQARVVASTATIETTFNDVTFALQSMLDPVTEIGHGGNGGEGEGQCSRQDREVQQGVGLVHRGLLTSNHCCR